jgi:hypothetical protein
LVANRRPQTVQAQIHTFPPTIRASEPQNRHLSR